jgi:hypothetical protein
VADGEVGLYNGYTPTVYAAPSALGSGNGSSKANATTLKAALNAASAGTIIGVADGTYSDSTALWYVSFNPAASGTEADPIVIVAENRHGATLEGYGSGLPAIQIWGRTYVTVDGFNIVGRAGLRGEEGVGSYCRLMNLNVTEGGIEGDDTSLNWGICVFGTTDCLVSNCKVSGMVSSGNTATNTAARRSSPV